MGTCQISRAARLVGETRPSPVYETGPNSVNALNVAPTSGFPVPSGKPWLAVGPTAALSVAVEELLRSCKAGEIPTRSWSSATPRVTCWNTPRIIRGRRRVAGEFCSTYLSRRPCSGARLRPTSRFITGTTSAMTTGRRIWRSWTSLSTAGCTLTTASTPGDLRSGSMTPRQAASGLLVEAAVILIDLPWSDRKGGKRPTPKKGR